MPFESMSLTSSDRPLTWNNSQRLVGDPAEAVARLKQSEGRDLLIQGSSTLYQPLLAAGLIDRLVLITFPVMLGRGKRWYSGDPATARSWTLVEQAHSPKGVHFASFARDGEVRTGSFATKPPSEDELALPPTSSGGSLVSLQLFGHPFSSYTWKVLIALWADGTPFKFRMRWPFRTIPPAG